MFLSLESHGHLARQSRGEPPNFAPISRISEEEVAGEQAAGPGVYLGDLKRDGGLATSREAVEPLNVDDGSLSPWHDFDVDPSGEPFYHFCPRPGKTRRVGR